MKSESIQDYLRAIYIIGEEKSGVVKSVDVAQYLMISKPSVSEMLKKLSEKGYLKAEPYASVVFRKKGLLEAEKQVFRYRVCQVFVNNILKIKDLEDIDKEADLLEHAFSDKSMELLDKMLGRPKFCPRGLLIPRPR